MKENHSIYNKVLHSLVVGLLPFYLFTFLPSEVSAKTKKQLVVLHTNDTHSTIMPLNENLDNKDLAGRGGFVRRVNMLKEERKQHPDLLFFDSGDFSQGSGYYTLFKGEVEVGLMNQMGYDAVTIGNHEFDFGLDNMAKLFRMANFPIVCSNYDFAGTPCDGLVKDYIILHRNGLKIGVFALGAPMKGLVSNKNCEGVKFLDPAETAKKYVKLLRKQEKCDVVICLILVGRFLSILMRSSSARLMAATWCLVVIPTPICPHSSMHLIRQDA